VGDYSEQNEPKKIELLVKRVEFIVSSKNLVLSQPKKMDEEKKIGDV
jgi:hypothetical protein